MRLQISFDLEDLDKSLKIAEQVAEYADILEIGSILLYKYGIASIEKFGAKSPKKTILADTKIVDRGQDIVKLIGKTGTNWISVMAGADKSVIHSLCTASHDAGKKVMLDLLDTDFIGQSALEAKSLGIDALLFHKVYETGTSLMFQDKWELVKGNTALPIFISAKITRENIDKIVELKPDGIIVGKPITDSKNPKAEAKFFAEKCS